MKYSRATFSIFKYFQKAWSYYKYLLRKCTFYDQNITHSFLECCFKSNLKERKCKICREPLISKFGTMYHFTVPLDLFIHVRSCPCAIHINVGFNNIKISLSIQNHRNHRNSLDFKRSTFFDSHKRLKKFIDDGKKQS